MEVERELKRKVTGRYERDGMEGEGVVTRPKVFVTTAPSEIMFPSKLYVTKIVATVATISIATI